MGSSSSLADTSVTWACWKLSSDREHLRQEGEQSNRFRHGERDGAKIRNDGANEPKSQKDGLVAHPLNPQSQWIQHVGRAWSQSMAPDQGRLSLGSTSTSLSARIEGGGKHARGTSGKRTIVVPPGLPSGPTWAGPSLSADASAAPPSLRGSMFRRWSRAQQTTRPGERLP